MRVEKALDLAQLQAELVDAGVVVTALGTTGTLETDDLDLFTYDANGAPADLPAGAAAVIAAHAPEEAPPTKAETLQELLDTIDPDDLTTDALQIMLLVQKEQLRP